MLLVVLAFVGGAVVEYFFGLVGKLVGVLKNVWSKIRNAI